MTDSDRFLRMTVVEFEAFFSWLFSSSPEGGDYKVHTKYKETNEPKQSPAVYLRKEDILHFMKN